MSLSPRALVAGIHLRWDGSWQRSQHLLTRLARHIPVVVIEEPFAFEHDRDAVTRYGGVTVIRRLRRRGWSAPFVDAQAIGTARVRARA